jgi:hypothetical protein
VSVNLDKTPPTIALDPGHGEQFDNSHPLLIIDYADTNGLAQSGIDLSTLAITLNGVNVTTNFYKFGSPAGSGAGRALWVTNLVANTYTWTASVNDYAGNTVSTTVVFTATGAINTNAPVMSELDLPGEGVTILPDMPEVWVQGKVSGQSSVVSASVNGGHSVPMNRREDIFGYLLPLEPGTNVIVLTASDSGTNNPSSTVLLVERSNRYEATFSWPGNDSSFGKFANGSTQTVTGVVSREFEVGDGSLLALASLTVNGSSVSIGSGGSGASYSVPLAPPACTNSVMPVVIAACWTGVTFSASYTNICATMPLGLLEGYEILKRNLREKWARGWGYYTSWTNGTCGTDWNINVYCPSWTPGCILRDTENTFDACASGGPKVTITDIVNTSGVFCASGWQSDWGSLNNGWDVTTLETHTVGQPASRGLFLGDAKSEYRQYTIYPSNERFDYVDFDFHTGEDAKIEFRAPFYYAPKTPVIFTLEGVNYARKSSDALDLTQVQLWGKSPISVDAASGNVNYLVEVTGGQTYTLDRNEISWPLGFTLNSAPNCYNIQTSANPDQFNFECDWTETSGNWLSFSGFHNDLPCTVLVLVGHGKEIKAGVPKVMGACSKLAGVGCRVNSGDPSINTDLSKSYPIVPGFPSLPPWVLNEYTGAPYQSNFLADLSCPEDVAPATWDAMTAQQKWQAILRSAVTASKNTAKASLQSGGCPCKGRSSAVFRFTGNWMKRDKFRTLVGNDFIAQDGGLDTADNEIEWIFK